MNVLHTSMLISTMLLTTLSIWTIYIQSVVADTLFTPGETVTFPNEGHSFDNIRDHVGRGAPCEAFSNPINPVSEQSGHHTPC